MKIFLSYLLKPVFILILFVIVSVFTSIQIYRHEGKVFVEGGKKYTSYNNYKIFKQSYYHLKEGKDLYKSYTEEHWDYYKYSPAFALFFGALAVLPDIIGLNIWNLLNALILFFAIFYIPKIDIKIRSAILLTILLELKISMQMTQSNALMAGLIILAFGLLERDKYLLAALCIVASVYIKLFGIVALALYIFYPKKWKLTLYTLMWAVLFLFIPLFVMNLSRLKSLYISWSGLLSNDYSGSYGLSVIGCIKSWFNLEVNKIALLIIGAIIFCLPFLKFKNYGNYHFRLLALCSLLLWIVLFNHKAESSSYIIAMSGIAIWFYTQKFSINNLVRLILAFIFISLSPTGIFPESLRENIFKPYVLIAIPAIIIWLKIVYDMSFKSKNEVVE